MKDYQLPSRSIRGELRAKSVDVVVCECMGRALVLCRLEVRILLIVGCMRIVHSHDYICLYTLVETLHM